MYKITSRQKRNADALWVIIKPSTLKGKKIDVFKNGIKPLPMKEEGYIRLDTQTTETKKERQVIMLIKYYGNILYL